MGEQEEKTGNVGTNRQLNADRLRDFSEAGSDWFFELDQNLCFTFVSVGFARLEGSSQDSMLGKGFFDVHAAHHLPLETELWQKQMEQMQAGKNWRDFVYTRVVANGARRIISNSGRAFFDEKGKFAGFRGVERDVTERVSAEAKLHSVVNTVPDAIITTDTDGLIASFSPSSERLFGYKEAELLGKNVDVLVPAAERYKHDGYIADYLQSGIRKIIGIGREVTACRKGGGEFPIHLSVNEMVVAGQRMFIAVVHDLSELTTARRLNLRLGQIVEQSLNEIYLFDEKTLQFVDVNAGGCRNLGYSKQQLLHKSPVDIKPEFTRKAFERVLAPLRSGDQELVVFNTIHRRRDDTTYPVEVHIQLMSQEIPPVFLAIIQDISEIERREAQLRQAQKMEAIGQLTGGIAHDFNNLLTVIIGNNELLGELLENDSQRELLDDSTGAADHAAQLTSQLLAFARQQPLSPQVLKLNDLINDMSEMLSRTLGEPIRLRTQLADSLWMTLADPALVHNAILNLSINARDAMPSGGDLVIETSNVEIDMDSLSLHDAPAPGRYVRLSVRDTGTGMTAEVKSRAMEPFFTTKSQSRGTGLGLSMVHGFAKQSGGFTEIYSEAGFGTAISLYLPDAVGAELDADVLARSTERRPATGNTILVVEDDPRVRAITVKRLKHLGYRILEADTADIALSKLKDHSEIDLVFSDMILPGGMTGGELLHQVENHYPEIRCLITSGYAEDGLIPNRGTRWLRKPYSMLELAETLAELLDPT